MFMHTGTARHNLRYESRVHTPYTGDMVGENMVHRLYMSKSGESSEPGK